MKTMILGLVLVAGCGAAFDTGLPDDATPVTTDEAMPAPLSVDQALEIPAPEHAAEAIALVVAAFGTQGTPDVHWYGGPRMRCAEDPDAIGWDSEPGHCVGGKEWSGLILVATAPGLAISAGSLTHELGHMRASERSGGDNDPNHLMTGIFGPGGEVYRYNKLLAAAGW